jgi:hypothetical protein
MGQMLGPLLAGFLVEKLGYEQGFETMAVISGVVLFVVWRGLKKRPAGAAIGTGQSN